MKKSIRIKAQQEVKVSIEVVVEREWGGTTLCTSNSDKKLPRTYHSPTKQARTLQTMQPTSLYNQYQIKTLRASPQKVEVEVEQPTSLYNSYASKKRKDKITRMRLSKYLQTICIESKTYLQQTDREYGVLSQRPWREGSPRSRKVAKVQRM